MSTGGAEWITLGRGRLAAVASKSKAPVVVGVVIVLLLLGVPLTAWLLRGVIATSMARGELEAHGIECDSRFSVEPSATFGEATVGATRCTHEGGVLEAIEIVSDVTVELDGFEPSSVEADRVRLVLRRANVRGGAGWASELARLDLEQRMAGVVKGLSELSALDLPPTHANRVEVVRGDAPLGSAEDVTLTPGSPLELEIARASFAAGPMNVGNLNLRNVTGTATDAEVTLRGRASARAGVAVIFSVERGGPFTLRATGLDTATPSFHLDGDL